MRTKASLVLNSDCETRETRTWHVQNTNPRRFYCKEEKKQNKVIKKECTQN
jgi:hypothetical protein